MKKVLYSDWLAAVQLKSNTSANLKRNTSANYKSDLQSTGIRDWNSIKIFINLRLHSKFSKHFQTLPNTFKTNFQKVPEDRFENFPTFFDFF